MCVCVFLVSFSFTISIFVQWFLTYKIDCAPFDWNNRASKYAKIGIEWNRHLHEVEFKKKKIKLKQVLKSDKKQPNDASLPRDRRPIEYKKSKKKLHFQYNFICLFVQNVFKKNQ